MQSQAITRNHPLSSTTCHCPCPLGASRLLPFILLPVRLLVAVGVDAHTGGEFKGTHGRWPGTRGDVVRERGEAEALDLMREAISMQSHASKRQAPHSRKIPTRMQSEAITRNQRQSEAIRGDQRRSEAIRGNQRRSEAIRGDQRRSHAIRGDHTQSCPHLSEDPHTLHTRQRREQSRGVEQAGMQLVVFNLARAVLIEHVEDRVHC